MSPAEAPSAPAVFLPWDTDFFGFRIGRANANQLTPASTQHLLAWSAAERLRCLYFFADPNCATTLSCAHDARFKFVDFRLEFSLDLQRIPAPPAPANIRPASAADLPALETLSRAAHTDTRFFKDSQFPADRAAELYAAWLRRDFREHRIFTLDTNAAPAGYITCQIDPATRLGRIGLIAVVPSDRGCGHGRRLLQGALAWFHSFGCTAVRVITQASNLPAQRLYQSAGFKTAEVAATFHRWF